MIIGALSEFAPESGTNPGRCLRGGAGSARKWPQFPAPGSVAHRICQMPFDASLFMLLATKSLGLQRTRRAGANDATSQPMGDVQEPHRGKARSQAPVSILATKPAVTPIGIAEAPRSTEEPEEWDFRGVREAQLNKVIHYEYARESPWILEVFKAWHRKTLEVPADLHGFEEWSGLTVKELIHKCQCQPLPLQLNEAFCSTMPEALDSPPLSESVEYSW